MKSFKIKSYLESNYPAIGKVNKYEKLSHRNINSLNHLIFSQSGKYLLKQITDSSSSKKIEKICKILNFCYHKNVKVPKLIQRFDGKFVDRKRKITLSKFYSGNKFNGTIEETKDLAKNVAILHKILRKYRGSFNYRSNEKFYKLLTLKELKKIQKKIEIKKRRTKLDNMFMQNYAYIKKCLVEDFEINKVIKRQNFQKQIIHSDLHPENVIFQKRKLLVILDFESIKSGRTLEDLAFAACRFGCYNTTSSYAIKKKIKLFVDAYLTVNYVDKQELNYIGYFFNHITLQRICYILRKYYFADSDLWINDFAKHLKLLKLIKKILPRKSVD